LTERYEYFQQVVTLLRIPNADQITKQIFRTPMQRKDNQILFEILLQMADFLHQISFTIENTTT